MTVIQLSELYSRTRVGSVKPCVVHTIIFHKDIDELQAYSQITCCILIILRDITSFKVTMHALEFLLLQRNEIGIIPIVIFCQQMLICMNRVSSFLFHNSIAFSFDFLPLSRRKSKMLRWEFRKNAKMVDFSRKSCIFAA